MAISEPPTDQVSLDGILLRVGCVAVLVFAVFAAPVNDRTAVAQETDPSNASVNSTTDPSTEAVSAESERSDDRTPSDSAPETLKPEVVEIAPPELLRKLRAIDSVYLSAFSVSGRDKLDVPLLNPSTPPVEMDYRFTCNESEMALLHTIVGEAKPRFIPQGTTRHADYDREGNLIGQVTEKRMILFDHTARTEVAWHAIYLVKPDDEATRVKVSKTVRQFAPDDPGPSLAIKKALWSTGRGFAKHLDEIISVDPRDDGLLAVSAFGFESPASRGRWELVLDPAVSYLVREARYTRNGRDTPTISMTMSGQIRDGSCEVASESDWTVDVGDKRSDGVAPVEARLEADTELLALARDAVDGPHDDAEMHLDYSSGDVQIVQKDRPERATDGASSAPQSRMRTFWTLFVVQMLAFICIFGVVRVLKERRAAAASEGQSE